MTFDEDELIICDPAHPAWRARLIHDDAAEQPWGDALCPALLIPARGQASFARQVFQPGHADRILAARRHLADEALLERYLRIVHGTTAVSHVTDRDVTVMLFDTAEYRQHAGCPAPCDLSQEHAEWRFWVDGEVFGITVEENTGTAAAPQWNERDGMWGFYGLAYARQRATELLAENITATTTEALDGGR